ncbi:WD40 repeat domain-containing protein [Arcobacter sp. YIC-80]|uniref:WD40 repeat domain-containing protein n=1 Tax=Arcobacter sp. YIC-80 TaxID=3376683 RepID=UPI00384DD46B
MSISRYFILLNFLFIFLNANELKPQFQYESSGAVTELIYKDNKLYASTDASCIDIFDTKTKEKITTILFPKIKDFMGDLVNSKIYSIDILKDKVLSVSQGEKGGRNLNIYQDGTFKTIISDKERMFIAKAKFLDKNRIVFALLSNEIYIYDINTKKRIKKVDVSLSKFSDFVLSEDKKKIVVADESGVLKMLTTDDLKLQKEFKNQNLDNVFQVALKNQIIATAGQDRRAVVYDILNNKAQYITAPFLIYSVGLSPSGKQAGIAYDEENNILIFDTKNKTKKAILIDNLAIISKILFINEKEIFVSSDDKKINYYKIKE